MVITVVVSGIVYVGVELPWLTLEKLLVGLMTGEGRRKPVWKQHHEEHNGETLKPHQKE